MRQPHVYNRTRNTNVFTSTRPTGLRPRVPWNGQAKSPFYRSVAHFFFPIKPSTRYSFIVVVPSRQQWLGITINKAKMSICFLSNNKFFSFINFFLFISIDYKSVKELSIANRMTVLDKGDRVRYRIVNILQFMARHIKSF